MSGVIASVVRAMMPTRTRAPIHVPFLPRPPARRPHLVAYDVSTVTGDGRRRLRAAARLCESAGGERVQWSLFDCRLSVAELDALRAALLGVLDLRVDRLTIVPLDGRASMSRQAYGPRPGTAAAIVVKA